MTLNQNEQKMAWIVGAVVLAAGLWYGYGQWSDMRQGLIKRLDTLKQQAKDNDTEIHRGEKNHKDFGDSRIQTINPDRPDYAPTQRLLENTFNNGGLVFTNWGASGSPRAIPSNREFQEAKYTATATTTTARLARFLQYIEAAKIPARIDGIDITAVKPGVDNLRVVFTISALLYAPKPIAATRGASTASRPASAPASGGPQPATTPAVPANLSKLELDMALRRQQETQRLATMPEAPTATEPATAPAVATGPAAAPPPAPHTRTN